jgi:sugar/nucleoside kinase (ribokinase family)
MSEPKGRGPAWTPLVPPDPPQARPRSDEGPPPQAARQAPPPQAARQAPPPQAARQAGRGLKSAPEASEWPLGRVTVLGAHILDVLGRPVKTIPPGQGSVRLREIRATAAGTAAGTGVDLAKLGARVLAVGALGDDLLGDIVVAAMARHGVDTAGLVRKSEAQTSATILPIRPNGERPAFHVPGATRLFTRLDVDLEHIHSSRALLIGAPDALAGMTSEDLAQIAAAARSDGALVAVDVLHPGRPQDLDRLAPLLAVTDWFMPNGDQILALTGRTELTGAIKDVLALGTAAVAVTCGADGCLVAGPDIGGPEALPALEVEAVDTTGCGDGFTAGLLAGLLAGAAPLDAAWLGLACGALVATGLGSDAGIENMGQVLDFLSGTQPAVAGRIKERMS